MRTLGRWVARCGLLVGLVVLFIGLVRPKGMDAMFRTNRDVAEIENLRQALELHAAEHGTYPPDLMIIVALSPEETARERARGFTTCVFVPTDPWDHEYRYSWTTGDPHPVLLSFGEDGAPGGEGESADLYPMEWPAVR